MSAQPARYASSEQILLIARRCALKAGIRADVIEDCALSFVARALLDETEQSLRPPEMHHLTGTIHTSWLARAALNHARDFRRHTRLIEDREAPWPRMEDGSSMDLPAPSPDAQTILLRREVAEALWMGAQSLEAAQRGLLIKHHVEGRSVRDLASDTGRSSNAIDQALLRARHRLRAWLERKGWAAEDMTLHLAAAPGLVSVLCILADMSDGTG